MASPTSFPWVDFIETLTSSISTTPTLIIGSENTCIFDSIWICNTSTQDITITAYTLVIDEPVPIYFRNSHLISNKSSQDILNTSIVNGIPLYAPSTRILRPTNLFHIYSNEPGTTFDCGFSGRKLLELSDQSLEKNKKEEKRKKLDLFYEYFEKYPESRKNIR